MMEWIASALSGVGLIVVVFCAIDCLLGWRRLRKLADPPPSPAAWPTVSVVIAARNEERGLRRALESVLALDYPDFQVIVVDDRSEDATGRILDEMARRRPALEAIHVDRLPAGWLGKNHALHQGAQRASGEFLLFTDADVVFQPQALRRAMAVVEEDDLDHLAVSPRVVAPGIALKVVVNVFSIFFSLFFRPWKASDPKSRAHIGVGAFNLVRTAAYRAIGGHEPIRMRPDDDVRLGRSLKRAGHRQAAATGGDLIEVEWYSSVGQLIEGLMKNTFAGVDYRLWMAAGATLGQVAFFLWPFVGVFAVSGWARWANLAVVTAILWLYAAAARQNRSAAWHGVFYPLAALLLIFVLWKSTWRTLREGGIRWRGTFYPLEELRK